VKITRTIRRTRPADGPLWALAAAVIVIAAGRVFPGAPAPSTAHADTVSAVGGVTILTSATGSGEDIVTVLDQRSDTLAVYRSTARRSLELVQVASVAELFEQSRAAGPATRR